MVSLRILDDAIDPFGKGGDCIGDSDGLTKGQKRGDGRDKFDHGDRMLIETPILCVLTIISRLLNGMERNQ